MELHQEDGLRYYTFESLTQAGVIHAIFTRHGGVSPAPWSALNMGGTVGDDPERVIENRHRAFRALGRAPDSLFDVWQVHGAEAVCAQAPRPHSEPHRKADIILTDRPEVSLFMRFADCVPIVLFDPVRQVVGLVHAGWQGTVRQGSAVAVKVLRQQYGSHPADLIAGIGPSIGPHHYQVGPEVVTQVQAAFGADAAGLLIRSNGSAPQGSSSPAEGSDGQRPQRTEDGVKFDLWAANALVLERAGVYQIEIAGICTACGISDWYSHRAEKGQTGRFGVLLALKPE